MAILISAWELATLAVATHPALQIVLVFRAEALAWKAFSDSLCFVEIAWANESQLSFVDRNFGTVTTVEVTELTLLYPSSLWWNSFVDVKLVLDLFSYQFIHIFFCRTWFICSARTPFLFKFSFSFPIWPVYSFVFFPFSLIFFLLLRYLSGLGIVLNFVVQI